MAHQPRLIRGSPSQCKGREFANQVLSVEYVFKDGKTIERNVHDIPLEIDRSIAHLKLASMGLEIKTFTPEQGKYLTCLK